MIRRLLLLTFGCLVAWVLISLPARALLDEETSQRTTLHAGTALLICLVPTGLTLVWAGIALKQSPELQTAAVLGGSGVRMFSVLLIAWLLHDQTTLYQHQSFWIWVLVAYLFTLALEMTLMLSGRPAQTPAPVNE